MFLLLEGSNTSAFREKQILQLKCTFTWSGHDFMLFYMHVCRNLTLLDMQILNTVKPV